MKTQHNMENLLKVTSAYSGKHKKNVALKLLTKENKSLIPLKV